MAELLARLRTRVVTPAMARIVTPAMARVVTPAMARAAAAAAAFRRAWRRSLQLRMVTITLVASGLLVGSFGYLVVELTTRSLINAATRDAVEQVTDGAEQARAGFRALGRPSNHPQFANEIRRQVLENLAAGRPGRGEEAIVALQLPPGVETEAILATPTIDTPVAAVVTPELADAVRGGGVSWQITTTSPFADQAAVTYLVAGSPVPTSWGSDAALYYFFPLTAEAETASTIRTIVLATGVTLVLLLVVITGLVTRLVVRPVRTAARTAQRLSAGLLNQRMTVTGEDDLARLAASFNQMAGNLQRQILRLEEMSRLQRRFTSDVSHELRTPLTTVRMAADVIFSQRDSYPPELARSAELLQLELDRFEALLSDLLEISRFDAGFAALETEPVDLVAVVRRVVDQFAAISARSGTEIRTGLPEGTIIAEVDQRRVERVLRNLVENALEHGAGQPVEVALAADQVAAAVTVRDHGVGLRPEESRLVFGRFWRADPSRARQSGGTGLGLSISVEDAKLHGGWLEVWGEPGQGAQFRLTLPLRAGEHLPSSPLPLVPPPAPEAPPESGDEDLAPDAAGRAGEPLAPDAAVPDLAAPDAAVPGSAPAGARAGAGS